MAAAVPLAVGFAAGGGAALMGATTATAINIGMMAMTAAAMLIGPKKQEKGGSTQDFAKQEYTARANADPLPRVYGTVRIPAHMVWYGNFYERETRKSEAQSKVY